MNGRASTKRGSTRLAEARESAELERAQLRDPPGECGSGGLVSRSSRMIGARAATLLYKLRFSQWFEDSILELSSVESVCGFRSHGDRHLTSEVGEIREGVPC